MSTDKHYLIVGAGLAGICLGWHLREKGCRITLIDDGQNKSSIIAAGMINPLVFRRMTKSWRADEFLPYARSFYTELETAFSVSFYHNVTIRRIFSSVQEREFWEEKQYHPEYTEYMTPISAKDDQFNKGHNPFGTGRVKGASYVKTQPFIESARAFFIKTGELKIDAFNHSSLDPERLCYKDNAYDGVIFCQGYLSPNNPFFKDTPIQQTKGETITIHCTELQTEESLNRKCFILPLGNDHYRVGATYVWNTPTNEITEKGKEELCEKFRVISGHGFDIKDQKAGIRPTTPDRRPVMGEHPNHKGIYIFNGLGTKGYMSAPLLALEYSEYLLDNVPLSEEVLLTRFKKR
jgi:glycine oxidase